MTIEQSWETIVSVVPANPPATDEDLAHVAEVIGAPLPDDIVASLKIHDGIDVETVNDAMREGKELPFGGWIMSCRDIATDWAGWKGVYDAENDEWNDRWWTPNLVPLVSDGGGNSVCVDLTTGQLMNMDHELGPLEYEFKTWAEYLAAVAANAESGAEVAVYWT
ncbi:SMI1/KNR4 family protein [Corynebacterium hansenii]|uniref:SMI1/KNR4 family protein n=1 Tax=Corynebacterium hansenii TaxID=394964 RepID=A0ABV7ZL55_9CORY|nr:SMI1/KNR4 family protein [Corynebacterium hansenii]WJY99343.1 SMI1 / KNR4 family protein [Corynebacterium hansenii]